VDTQSSSAGAKQPGEQDKRNETEASEANKDTIANVQKHETDKEKQEPEFRPNT